MTSPRSKARAKAATKPRPKVNPHKKLAHDKKADRRTRVLKRALEGAKQKEIAEEEGVTQATVSRDLTDTFAEMARNRVADMVRWTTRLMARNERIIDEAEKAWARSQDPKETVEQVRVLGEDGQPTGGTKVTVKRAPQVGTPRFLEIMQRGIEIQAKLLGVTFGEDGPGRDSALAGEAGKGESKGESKGILTIPVRVETRTTDGD